MRVRVGGGIRTAARAKRILDAGAEKIIVGSAAFRDGKVNAHFSRAWRLGSAARRIIVAVDTDGGRILVRGWQEKLRLRPEEVFRGTRTLRFGVSVHLRGRRRHHARHQPVLVPKLRRATPLPITAAGGIRSQREVRALERIGMNSAVGMALYLDKLR